MTDVLTEKYSTEFVDPKITVFVRTYEGNRVYVDGEVGNPQMLRISPNFTVAQAIASAGGLTDKARRHDVRVIRRKADKKPLVIPVDYTQVLDGTDIRITSYNVCYTKLLRSYAFFMK